MKRVINMTNPRYLEYNEYLNTHINGVIQAWHTTLRPQLLSNLGKFDVTVAEVFSIDAVIANHDMSKHSPEEYNAYCDYFYPCEGFDKNKEEFDRAWLHHQNVNPHHPEYWVLIDDGEMRALDMPFENICEMLCDWHSFSLRDPSSTAYSWWNKNKDNMVISKETRATIESMIDYFTEPLK